jgi:hypothetical protein
VAVEPPGYRQHPIRETSHLSRPRVTGARAIVGHWSTSVNLQGRELRVANRRHKLIQGQRDFFGAHTYRRVDKDGSFHTLWSGDRSEVSR